MLSLKPSSPKHIVNTTAVISTSDITQHKCVGIRQPTHIERLNRWKKRKKTISFIGSRKQHISPLPPVNQKISYSQKIE
ncbi:hypothetical protein Glove_144g163 [Diversispora epigaea]|uniref:Uncharacterized protein n=1 Tax=Diversispora epigaea TaxID=1348612 RepID=A0A397J2V0_9GLOM|nr:hypothetical protein Glove_144g163 [Diversispora epigaea]